MISYQANHMYAAVGLLAMMYPILCKVQYETLHRAFRSQELWRQIGFSAAMNWIFAPFLMVTKRGPTAGQFTD